MLSSGVAELGRGGRGAIVPLKIGASPRLVMWLRQTKLHQIMNKFNLLLFIVVVEWIAFVGYR